MKKSTKATLAAFGIVSLFLGCGGSGGDSMNDSNVKLNATLDSTDDAARALVAAGLAVDSGAFELPFIIEATQSNPACNQNDGSRTINGFSSTSVDASFVNCDSRTAENGITVDVLLDGRIRARCNDGEIDDCADLTATLGENSARLLADVEVGLTDSEFTGGDPIIDSITQSLGTIRIVDASTSSTDTFDVTLSLTAAVEDQLTSQSYNVVTSNFQINSTFNVNDEASTTSYNGEFSLTGLNNCLAGGINIVTDSPIVTNANDELQSGTIRLSNNSGQTATIEFNDDESILITANGMSQRYSERDFDAFCD